MMYTKLWISLLKWLKLWGKKTNQKTVKAQIEKTVHPVEETVTVSAEKIQTELSCQINEVHEAVIRYLFDRYDFRYNLLTEQVEFRERRADCTQQLYVPVNRRTLNTLVIEVRRSGVNCWDKDVDRLLKSNFIPDYHPFYAYMDSLPEWDGQDRITALAQRVAQDAVWVNGFRRWMLGLTAQWMGQSLRCANTLIPILISSKQGYAKSTFCRLLMPPELKSYYLDKFDLNARSNVETKLGQFGLINLDEFDRYSVTALASLKNLVQLKDLTVRKTYTSYFQHLSRIASFIGTSNQMELLNDLTGSRRFLCVEVNHPIDCSPVDHVQLFAQLRNLIETGERVWMDADEEQKLQQHNLLYSRLHPEQEVFYSLYRRPEADEQPQYLTTTEIHRSLCRTNPSAMRGINVLQLGRTLSTMGLKRIHTEMGNRYGVVKVV